MKRKLLFAMLCIVSALGMRAQQEPVSGTSYYLYNVETGKFLTRGNTWGTQGVTNDFGSPWQVTISDGAYTLRMLDIVTGGGTSGLGANGYSDNGSPIAFTPSGDASGYKLQNGSNYLTSPATYGNNVLAADANGNTTWQFLNVDEYKAVLAAKTTAQEAAIATTAGIDLGAYTLTAVVTNTDYWRSIDKTSSVAAATPSNSTWTRTGVANRGGNANNGTYGIERYQGGGTESYTVTGLTKGLYKVGVKAMFRSASNAICYSVGQAGYVNSSAYFSANGNLVQIKDWYSSCTSNSNPNSTGEFVTIANNGGYYSEVYAYVGDAGTLELKAVSESYWGVSWFLFNGVTLTYYTDEMDDASIEELIATIPAAGTIPTAVTTNLSSLRSTLESEKTIAAYNALNTAITAANAFLTPFAAYLAAAEDAGIAGVASETITAQNTAANAATTVDAVEACTEALVSATLAVTSYDITDYTITNANPVSNVDGWTCSASPNAFDSGNNCAEFWNLSAATMKQTITLPAGNYCLTVVALQRTGMAGTIEAAGKTTTIAQVSSGDVNNRTGANTWFNAGNGVNNVYFTLDEEQEVTIGINVDGTTGDHWTVFRSFQLSTYNESVAASYLRPGYETALATAQSYQSEDMLFDSEKTALNTAIEENTVDEESATIAAYETAIANLNAASAAAATAVANCTRYNNIVDAIGENTNVDLTAYVENADFETNSLTAWTSVNGGNVANNGNFNSTYFVERWKNGVALGDGSLTHDVFYLPAGVYLITADAQNIEQYNSAAAGTGLFLCANDEQTEIGAKGNYSVYVKVADKGALTIKFLQDDCTGNWVSYDNVTLTYVDADFPAYTLVDGNMKATVAAAQTAANEAFEASETGTNYKALLAAIAAAQASKDAYAVAATAVTKANAIKEAHNFASAAATTTFEEAIAAISDAYDDATLADDDANAAGTTLGTVVTGWHANPNGAASNYMEDGFSLNDFDADLYVNTWSTEGDTDGTGFSVPFYEYWNDDANSLSAKTWTGTLTGLSNGQYQISAWVRVRAKNETAASDATGITMQVNDGDAVDVTEGGQVGETQFNIGRYNAVGLVRDGSLTLSFDVAEENNISWLSFQQVKYTKLRDLTPEEAATYPTAIALYVDEDEVTEVALDKTNNTVTLTPVYTPADASEGFLSWSSDDEDVATVADGVVTAVLPGTTTITATSTLDGSVSASVTVTVTYPESEYAASYYVNDGATRTVYALGENLIKNGVFEYPDAFYGWTSANNYSSEILESNGFSIKTDDSGNKYLFGTASNGASGVGSLGTAWEIEPGKTYKFAYDVKKDKSSSTNYSYLKTSLTNTKGTESKVLGYPASVTTDWTTVEYTFTNGEEGANDCYQYIQVAFRWLESQWGFRNFYLAEATYTLEGNVDYATDAIPTENIGTGAFQYSQDAIDATNAANLVQGTATVQEVQDAYDALAALTLNVPDAEQAYNLVFNCDGHTADGNALTLIPNPAQAQGLYGLKYLAPANQNLAQAFYFTHTTGNKYKLHAIDQDDAERYITTQAEGYGTTWYEGIRTTDDAEKAMEVEIRPNGEGLYLLWNTGANKALAHNGNNNNDLFTNNTANFQFVETTKPSIEINTTAAGWGTVMLPFAVDALPEGVKAYTCAAVNETTSRVTMEEVTELEANKPYIIEGAWNETLTGDAKGAALTYTEGYLTGVYANTAAPVGSYVMQKQDDRVAFYIVGESQPTVKANRAYLTVPGAEGVKAFFLGDDATGIRSIDGESGDEVIYNLAGQRVSKKAGKGVYIVNGKKIAVK